jgi:hypothetical protein
MNASKQKQEMTKAEIRFYLDVASAYRRATGRDFVHCGEPQIKRLLNNYPSAAEIQEVISNSVESRGQQIAYGAKQRIEKIRRVCFGIALFGMMLTAIFLSFYQGSANLTLPPLSLIFATIGLGMFLGANTLAFCIRTPSTKELAAYRITDEVK